MALNGVGQIVDVCAEASRGQKKPSASNQMTTPEVENRLRTERLSIICISLFPRKPGFEALGDLIVGQLAQERGMRRWLRESQGPMVAAFPLDQTPVLVLCHPRNRSERRASRHLSSFLPHEKPRSEFGERDPSNVASDATAGRGAPDADLTPPAPRASLPRRKEAA